MKDLIWKIKVFIWQRRCVRCNKLIFGEAESVNIYRRVVGSHKDIKHIKPCKLEVGSPQWVKLFWLSHFMTVIYQPDWFSKYAYESAWKEDLELVTDPKIKERIAEFPLTEVMNHKYPNTWDKESH